MVDKGHFNTPVTGGFGGDAVTFREAEAECAARGNGRRLCTFAELSTEGGEEVCQSSGALTAQPTPPPPHTTPPAAHPVPPRSARLRAQRALRVVVHFL
jgi:hypothetical protein